MPGGISRIQDMNELKRSCDWTIDLVWLTKFLLKLIVK